MTCGIFLSLQCFDHRMNSNTCTECCIDRSIKVAV